MRLIRQRLFGDETFNFKAPSGLQFFVEQVAFHFYQVDIDASSDIRGYSWVLDTLEEEGFNFEKNHQLAECHISYVDVGTQGMPQNFIVPNINHKTKYLSILSQLITGDQLGFDVIIYGDYVPISKDDALWEFLRKASQI